MDRFIYDKVGDRIFHFTSCRRYHRHTHQCFNTNATTGTAAAPTTAIATAAPLLSPLQPRHLYPFTIAATASTAASDATNVCHPLPQRK